MCDADEHASTDAIGDDYEYGASPDADDADASLRLLQTRILHVLQHEKPEGVTPSALRDVYATVFAKAMPETLLDTRGKRVALSELVFYHPEVVYEPVPSPPRLYHAKHRVPALESGAHAVQRELLALLAVHTPPAIRSSKIPDLFFETHGYAYKSAESCSNVTLSALLRWHPDVRCVVGSDGALFYCLAT
jgi:hypothetical protein